MSECFLGEIRMFCATFAPVGWHLCDGSLLSIPENDALFSLLGTTYGGDGQTTFGLPDLRGRVPIHVGGGYAQGDVGGVESVTLTSTQLPAHGHGFFATTTKADQASAAGNVVGDQKQGQVFRESDASVAFAANALGIVGGGQPHSNVQPYQCVNYIIATEGIFPPQG
jgi:microcystin-dependent protein